MKKQEKIDILQRGIDEKQMCRCYFSYDDNYCYYYPNRVNDRFFLGQEEDDFLLDGYCIRKLSQLKMVELREDKCGEINRLLGVTDQIADPGIDISSWQSIFQDLMERDYYIILEDENNGQLEIGRITKVLKDRIYFLSFDADGVWAETDEEFIIRYGQITTVRWENRYVERWRQYLEGELTVGN